MSDATQTSQKPNAPARSADTGIDVVTGAFSYSGSAIAAELQRRGRQVRTLTGHARRGGGRDDVDIRPLDFGDLPGLEANLQGVTTLYNTYWVRFPHGDVTHETAVGNSRALFQAARRAGVARIVHISITHPSVESRFSYFRGKALVERQVAETGMPYSILRPAILFGGNGVLINNIAWLLRHIPVFAIGGTGDYRIRPIHVDDLATLAVDCGETDENGIIDAVGPERPTFQRLIEEVREAVGSRARIIHVPGAVLPVLGAGLNTILRDVLLTADEYRAMSQGLADTDGPPTGQTALSSWLEHHGKQLGVDYANELDRHYRS